MASITQSKAAAWIARHALPAGMAVVGVFLLLGYAFIFRPMIAGIRAADLRQRLETERAAKEEYLGKLRSLENAYEAVDADDVERIRAMIPSEQDVPGLMAMLETAARASDVQLTAINFADGDTTGLSEVRGLGAMAISLSLSHGSYERFKLFLDSLETNLRLFDVRSANLSPATASYSLTLRAYVWKKSI